VIHQDATKSGRFPAPRITCEVLADQGIPTSGYKVEDGDDWCCFGDVFPSGTDVLIPDEVSYIVNGDQSTVREITIEAEHYRSNPRYERRTLNEASSAAETLLRKLGGRSNPAAVRAVRMGRPGSWPMGNSLVILVERDEYPTGKGYSIYFRIRPAPTS